MVENALTKLFHKVFWNLKDTFQLTVKGFKTELSLFVLQTK